MFTRITRWVDKRITRWVDKLCGKVREEEPNSMLEYSQMIDSLRAGMTDVFLKAFKKGLDEAVKKDDDASKGVTSLVTLPKVPIRKEDFPGLVLNSSGEEVPDIESVWPTIFSNYHNIGTIDEYVKVDVQERKGNYRVFAEYGKFKNPPIPVPVKFYTLDFGRRLSYIVPSYNIQAEIQLGQNIGLVNVKNNSEWLIKNRQEKKTTSSVSGVIKLEKAKRSIRL